MSLYVNIELLPSVVATIGQRPSMRSAPGLKASMSGKSRLLATLPVPAIYVASGYIDTDYVDGTD